MEDLSDDPVGFKSERVSQLKGLRVVVINYAMMKNVTSSELVTVMGFGIPSVMSLEDSTEIR